MKRFHRVCAVAILTMVGTLAACSSNDSLHQILTSAATLKETALALSSPVSSSAETFKETAVALVSPVVGNTLNITTTPAPSSPAGRYAHPVPPATPSPNTGSGKGNNARPPEDVASPSPAISPGGVETYPQIAREMLGLVNADRRANKLQDVVWDDFAAQVGSAHASDLAHYEYFNHINRLGQGPDLRYALAGGVDAEFENLYSLSLKYSDGRAGTIGDWASVLKEAEQQLMNSPGHREQILAPDHTHVGIGVAWNPQAGELCISQEFLNHYAILAALPHQVAAGDNIDVSLMLLDGVSQPLINLAWEPVPTPLVQDEWNKGHTYQSPARLLEALPVQTKGSNAQAHIKLPGQGQPGYYHIRLWAKREGRDVLILDPVVLVQ